MQAPFLVFLQKNPKVLLAMIVIVVVLIFILVFNSAVMSAIFGQSLTCKVGGEYHDAWMCIDVTGQVNEIATAVNLGFIVGIIVIMVVFLRKMLLNVKV